MESKLEQAIQNLVEATRVLAEARVGIDRYYEGLAQGCPCMSYELEESVQTVSTAAKRVDEALEILIGCQEALIAEDGGD